MLIVVTVAVCRTFLLFLHYYHFNKLRESEISISVNELVLLVFLNNLDEFVSIGREESTQSKVNLIFLKPLYLPLNGIPECREIHFRNDKISYVGPVDALYHEAFI